MQETGLEPEREMNDGGGSGSRERASTAVADFDPSLTVGAAPESTAATNAPVTSRPLRWLSSVLPSAYREIITDQFTLKDNPVFRREALRDSRRRDREILVAIALFTLWAVFAIAYTVTRELASNQRMIHGVPRFLGGGYGTAVLILFSGVHLPFIYHAAWRRTYNFFLQEYRNNTIQPLLCTRITPFQLILQASFYPFGQAMRIAVLGLPFYAFACSLGGVKLLDIVGLYLLYMMISFRPPRWTMPVLSNMTADDIAKRQRVGGKQPPQNLVEGLLRGGAGSLLGLNPLLNWAFGPGWLMKIFFPLTALLPIALRPMLWTFPLSWGLVYVRWLWTPFTFYVLTAPPIVFVLPLYLVGRLIAIWSSSVFLRTGDQEQIATLFDPAQTTNKMWDIDAFLRARKLYASALVFVFWGFVWKPYVIDRFSFLETIVSSKGGTLPSALMGLLWLFGVGAAFGFWARVRQVSLGVRASRLPDAPADLAHQKPNFETVKYLLGPLVSTYAFYAAICLCGGVWPFPGPVALLFGKLLAITLAGATLLFGANLIRPVHMLVWLLALPLWAIPLTAVGMWGTALAPQVGLFSLSEHSQRIVTSVPFLENATVPTWFQCVTVQMSAGLLCMAAWAYRTRKQAVSIAELTPWLENAVVADPNGLTEQSPQTATGAASIAYAPPGRLGYPLVMPLSPLPESATPQPLAPLVLADETPKKGPVNKKEHPAALRLIAWAQRRWDNALLTKEMRTLLRGHLGPDEIVVFPILAAVVISVLVYYSNFTLDILNSSSRLFFGDEVSGWGGLFGGLITWTSILFAIFMPILSATQCGGAFTRERDRSTLGFILVTPLSTSSILFGKLLGVLSYMLVYFVVLACWNALLALPLLLFISPTYVLWGWAQATAPALALSFMSALFSLPFSMIFKRDSDASGLGLLLHFGALGGATYLDYLLHEHLLNNTTVPLIAEPSLWLLCTLPIFVVIVPLSIAFSLNRLRCARTGDVAFESAKR